MTEAQDVGDVGVRVLPGGVIIRWRCELVAPPGTRTDPGQPTDHR